MKEGGGSKVNTTSSLASISPTFYEELFCVQLLSAAFLELTVWVVFFWKKELGTKPACKMLVKLTKVVVDARLKNADSRQS